MLCGRLYVAGGSLGCRLFLNLSQDCPEPGHVPVAAQVGDDVPGLVADLWEENRTANP